MSTQKKIESIFDEYVSGYSLPQAFYLNQDIYKLEWEHIWKQSWLYAGTIASLPHVGDYFVYNIMNESIIVIKGDHGKIYAHYNTCPHRGSLICTEDRGHASKLMCPYHNWTFNKDGSLFKARLMPDDFDKSLHGLRPIRITDVNGFLFICLSENPPDISILKKDFEPFLKPFSIHQAKVAYTTSYKLRTNWKLVGENFRECYHCGPAHPEYCSAVIGANKFESADHELDKKISIWNEKGLETTTIPFTDETNHFAIRYPLRPGIKSYSTDGESISIPMGKHTDYDAGVLGMVVYPNFWMDAVSDYMWTMKLTPVSASETIIDLEWLVDKDAQEGTDYTIERLIEFWKITGEQDWALCENNFKGIESSRYKPGPLAPAEIDVVKYDDWYVNRMRKSINL